MAELVVTATESIEKVVADEILTGADEQAIARVNGEHRARRGDLIARHRGIHRVTS